MLRHTFSRAARGAAVAAFCAVLIAPSGAALAASPPPEGDPTTLLGFYQGDVQGQNFNCPDPGDDELFALPLSLTIDQVGSARGSFVTGDGDAGTINLDLFANGSVNGQAEGSSPDGTTFDLSLSGLFENDQLSLSFSGSDSEGCLLSGNILVSRVQSAAADPANSSPSVIQNTEGARTTSQFANALAGIARQRRTGGGTGALAMGNGFMIQGKAAGSGGMALGAWAGLSRTKTENDFASTAFEDRRVDFLVGIDTTLDNGALVGVAFGIQTGETETAFNSGEQDVTALTVAPYVGMLLTDWLSFDATIGYSEVQIDQFRIAPGTGAVITSDVDSMRAFAAVNLAATHSVGNLLLTGLGGLSWATQRDDAFRESGGLLVPAQSSSVGRFLLGGEAAYSAGGWEPYARAMVEHDFSSDRVRFAPGVAQPENDDTDVLVSFGLRYFSADNLSAALEYSTLLGRRNLDEDTLSANVRWQF